MGDAAGGGGGGANIPQWKAPSAAHQQKYSLVPLPEDFEPTQEETSLLNFYETIRSYERQAARLKDAAARAKLAAKDAEFQKSNATNDTPEAKKNKRKKKKNKTPAEDIAAGDSDQESMGSASDASDMDEDEEEHKSSYDKREEKLQALRAEVNAKMNKDKDASDDAIRQEYLASNNAEDVEGPSFKRKKLDDAPKSSLIASISNQATPPHDFSKKLELKPFNGNVLFPTSTEDGTHNWAPPSDATSPDEGMTLELDNFDISQAQNGIGNNTVAIKFMAPQDSRRFSLNIAAPDHDNFHSVLFHFNPRHFERGGQLVLNNKQEGIWGSAINVPLSQIPLIFGETSCTLILQINGEGFDVFLNDKHIARLEHRSELGSSDSSLFLNFPATDDYGSPENWMVYKVWWGNKPTMAKGDLSDIPGYKSFNSLHPRKLFISKLPKIHTDPEVDLRRAELERAFRKYGGDRGVTVVVPKNTTFAFVEMESERQADLALQEMATKYRINRARRTRHEALQEERAAAEAAKLGKPKENSDWD